MPLADLPESVLFLIFLLMFVIAGIYPAWQKVAPKIRKFLERHTSPSGPGSGRFPVAQASSFERGSSSAQLQDYDMFVFRLLAQADKKGLSRKQIAAGLHMEPAMVKQALESLNARHLIRVSVRHSILVRFHLSKAGHAWAVEQGIVPRILVQEEDKSKVFGGG